MKNTITLSACALLAMYGASSSQAAPRVAGCSIFPANAVFNTRIDEISKFPTHALSDDWVARIGSGRRLHLDMGRNENQQAWETYYGIPYNVVGAGALNTNWPSVSFDITDPRAGNGDGVPEESDCARANGSRFDLVRGCNTLGVAQRRFPFPAPEQVKAEYGHCNDSQVCGDRHVLIIEKDRCRLWESYFTYHVDQQWYAYSTAGWDMNSNAIRPDTWTSGDAAGLPIFPLLMRVDEAEAGLIEHAFRITFSNAVLDRAYQWPARHDAGGAVPQGIPFGAVVRLKASALVPENWTTEAKAVATAMKRYGLYVADIGSNMYVQGEPSARWDTATFSNLQSLTMDKFEFVDMSSITSHAGFIENSFAVPGLTPPTGAQADLSATLTGNNGWWNPATKTYRYTANVRNDGPNAASNTAVRLLYPEGATLHSLTMMPNQGSCQSDGSHCSLGHLNAQQSVTLTVTLHKAVAALADHSITVSSDTADRQLTNNTATAKFGGSWSMWGIALLSGMWVRRIVKR